MPLALASPSSRPAEAAAAPATLAALAPEARAILCALRRGARAAQIGAAGDAATALMAALDAGATRPMVFHPRGAEQVAFAESWAVALISAVRRGDEESAAFLVGRCIAKRHRRAMLHAATRVAAAVGGEDGR